MKLKDPYTPDGYVRFTLRIPESLFNEVKALAGKDKRSTGRQIEFMLEQFLSKDKNK